MQFLCEGIQKLYRQESENWGEGENKAKEVAVFQGREGTEGEGE